MAPKKEAPKKQSGAERALAMLFTGAAKKPKLSFENFLDMDDEEQEDQLAIMQLGAGAVEAFSTEIPPLPAESGLDEVDEEAEEEEERFAFKGSKLRSRKKLGVTVDVWFFGSAFWQLLCGSGSDDTATLRRAAKYLVDTYSPLQGSVVQLLRASANTGVLKGEPAQQLETAVQEAEGGGLAALSDSSIQALKRLAVSIFPNPTPPHLTWTVYAILKPGSKPLKRFNRDLSMLK
ncbi:ATP-dependent DNA helicase [Chlorella sorokiniana]|uniref:ATP-dependent DNA helicase n=1 Tax=Chlorella sorokiniana TaxID=3076 RepID=A0A2P6TSI4_CHLSO|nr:ATP-dependent DNA helicase [Chlorella sorokiniana]|eukprot:PRW57013.1 ATP-dependent DNA helicase [Chlorella sorokiniana]